MEDLLNSIYYNSVHPASYSSVNKLYKAAKVINKNITLKFVKDWLSGELTYTLHKNARKNFKRNKIFVSKEFEQYQADLVDMTRFAKENKNYNYILTVIDCFSKYVWAIPVKNKTGLLIKNALEKVFIDQKPEKLQTDRGKEFLNSSVQNYLKNNNIEFFTTQNSNFKCAIVERFNRTLKTKMWKIFTKQGSRKYLNILQNLVDSINNSVHSTTKFKPVDVNSENENIVFYNIYGYNSPRDYLLNKSKPDLKIGDTVRKKYDLNVLNKSYWPNWSDHIYKINNVYNKNSRPMYSIEEENGNVLKRRFYNEEIQKVKENYYRIERLIKKKKQNGVNGYIVKWLNFPDSYNSWVGEKDIKNMSLS